MQQLPEFSSKTYNIVGYVVATLITCSGGWLIYEILFNSNITFSANWNMFDSILIWPLYIIGLLVMFANWSTFSFTFDFYEKYTDSYGNSVTKKSWDIIDWMIGHVLMPILGRFFLVPIMVAALIYYPLMFIVHLVGAIFPYILSLIIIIIIGCSWMFTSWFQFRYHSIALVLIGIVFTGIFTLGATVICKPNFDGNIQLLYDGGDKGEDMTDTIGNDNDFEDGDFADDSNKGSDNVNEDFNEPDSDEFEEPKENVEDIDSNPDDEFTEDNPDDQFGGSPCDGLYSQLPDGTTELTGDMAGFPIEFTIKKHSERGILEATYKNVKFGTKMELSGESLPAMDCDINFFGKADGQDWTFYLTGTLDNINGTARSSNGKDMKVNLHKK